jgi:two-component system sensor kinase FixL
MIGQPIAILATPATADEMPRILETVGRGERVEHYETERRRKDGQIIAVALTISPVCDDAGRIVGASKIARDITAAKRDADGLIQREALLSSILETVPDAMVVIDERGIVQPFSAAAERMFGYAASGVCGGNVSILMPTPHRERHDSYIARYLATGSAASSVSVGSCPVGARTAPSFRSSCRSVNCTGTGAGCSPAFCAI